MARTARQIFRAAEHPRLPKGPGGGEFRPASGGQGRGHGARKVVTTISPHSSDHPPEWRSVQGRVIPLGEGVHWNGSTFRSVARGTRSARPSITPVAKHRMAIQGQTRRGLKLRGLGW